MVPCVTDVGKTIIVYINLDNALILIFHGKDTKYIIATYTDTFCDIQIILI